MRTDMTFNEAAIIADGYTRDDIYNRIKKAFEKFNLPCTSDNDTLSFEDTGDVDDFAYMWNIIIELIKTDWYIKYATSCYFFDDCGKRENVLCQADYVRKELL